MALLILKSELLSHCEQAGNFKTTVVFKEGDATPDFLKGFIVGASAVCVVQGNSQADEAIEIEGVVKYLEAIFSDSPYRLDYHRFAGLSLTEIWEFQSRSKIEYVVVLSSENPRWSINRIIW